MSQPGSNDSPPAPDSELAPTPANIEQSWYYPNALHFTLRRALAVTRADTLLPAKRQARMLATYEKMLALLDTMESGRGRPTVKENLANDTARRDMENAIADALNRLTARHVAVDATSLADELLMPRKMLLRYLDALNYGHDPRFW
jgi:hypothetical protein